ncbi:S8 family peptidase [Natrialba asiatica]|uniref:Peptidase S8 and S53 subtilisin kexin sedolisin n=1 Tax=Natrialba asiatica (strain ATCC 700177 / DSM 12278 / JCM 9576 / FERM P-10747 / NBRC 102637 / 172P1) TaxID=29540 RepID=M0AYB2_NATA1|nr:S8 family peptidase [Natrialba asiatica]ELZ03485.1 peptidase S8 and S53 subtilisin kexin sedolisin [Natrialba asiatica DSM 12278]
MSEGTNTYSVDRASGLSMNKQPETQFETRIRRRPYLRVAATAGIASATLGGTGTVAAQDDAETTRQYNVGHETEAGREHARDVAVEVHHEFEALDITTVNVAESDLDALGDHEDIRFVEENIERSLDLPDSDPEHQLEDELEAEQWNPWGVERIGALAAHERGETGCGVHVAVIDTGIDPTHEDLHANIGEGVAFVETTIESTQEWADDFGHGTHVSGTIAALDNDIGVVGVSPSARLHPVKVLDNQGTGTDADIAAGIEYAARKGYDIANLSVGEPETTQTQTEAVKFAYEEGLLLVAATGNDGHPKVDYPADLDEVIGVSATAKDDSLAPFSNTGPEVNLAAPGSPVLSTIPGSKYGVMEGTSMATPHVSGSAALLAAHGLSNAEIRDILTASAENIGLGPDAEGSGLVNASAALKRLDTMEPEVPSE